MRTTKNFLERKVYLDKWINISGVQVRDIREEEETNDAIW